MMMILLLLMPMMILLSVDALSLDATTKKLLPKARVFTKRSNFALYATPTTDNENQKDDEPTTITNLRWFPTRIELEGITRSYGPPNLWRQLTSSVPVREFALQNITVAFGNKPTTRNLVNPKEDALCLLLGASSSGKSTLVGTILNSFYDTPDPYDTNKNQGTVTSRKFSIADITEAYPILLDDRGAVNELGNSNAKTAITVAEAWSFAIQETLEFHPKRTEFSETIEKDLTKCLIQKLSDSIFGLDPETRLIDLTPSERYRFCLGKACINSSVMGTILKKGDDCFNLPGPILFLDEWMDVETSEVVRKVQPSLQNIVQDMKGVVISITHKPELYYATGTPMSSVGSGGGDDDDDSNVARVRKITLSAGKILSDL